MRFRRRLRWAGVFLFFLVIANFIAIGPNKDWYLCFKPAALAIRQGHSPYTSHCFHNPPWAAALVVPFSYGRTSEIVLIALILFTVARVARYLGASVLGTVLVLISPPTFWLVHNAQFDWLTLWAVMSPAPLALILAIVKPQIGAVLALWFVVRAWKKGGIIRVIATCIPFLIVLLVSFALTGLWILKIPAPGNLSSNASPWPWLIPLGMGLFFIAITQDKLRYALLAGPFLTPYLVIYSYIGAAVAISRQTWIMVLLVGLPYIVMALFFMSWLL